MRRIVRGLAAVVALAALLGGVPMALSRFVGRPWPSPLPSLDTIWSSIQAGDISDTTVIKALAVLVWIAWARLALSIVVEVGARIAGSPTPRVAGLGSAQRWAAGLVAAVILMISVSPRGALAATAPAGPRPIPAALLQPEPIRPAMAAPSRFEFALESAAAGAMIARPVAPVVTATHTVERHESFWSIAEVELGDGARWREIVELNRGIEVSPGVVFDGTPSRLVPGWVLLVPSDGAADAPAGSAPPVSPAAPAPVPDPATVPEVASEPSAPVPEAAVPERIVVVERGDTLSEIADELGDASDWPELFEANRGREFDGRTFDDPNLILAGWELVVPSGFDPPSSSPVDAPIPSVQAVEVPVETPQPPPAAPEVTPADAPVASTPNIPIDVIQPVVATVDPPPVTSTPTPAANPAPTDPGPTTMPAAPVPPTMSSVPDARVVPHVDSAAQTEGDQTSRSVPAGLGAGVLLSSGVLAAVISRRRRRLRAATVSARLADRSTDAIATETVMRSLGDGERIARLDIALRAVAGILVDLAPGAAVLGTIVGRDGTVDVLLTEAVPAPPDPWLAVTGHRWRLAGQVALHRIAAAARRANQPCPAIAHIGMTRLGDGDALGDVFIDLEATGLLTICGERSDATNVLRALAAGVAVSPMSEIAHIIATGLDDVVLGHPLSVLAESIDSALDLAANAIGTTAAVTSASLSTFALRARHQGGEAWEPAIVFAACGEATSADSVDADLIALTNPSGRGLAVVVDRPVEGARWRLEQGAADWTLHPLGLAVVPIGLTAPELVRVRELLEDADRPLIEPDISSDTPVTVHEVSLDTDPAWGAGGWVEPDWPLMVRVLGQVGVIDHEGRSVEFERSKALELVVWLSQHRDRCVRSAARTALWELDVRDATFANVVSDARRAMARLVPTVDNQEWIGRTLTEQLPLHPAVVTDADLLGARLAHARRQAPIDAIATLRPGLELVRDVPFSGTSYLWPDTEGVASQLTLLVTSAAAVLAGHSLSIGDIDGVFWATGRGLQVLSGHEELISLRMRAHARNGDLAGVRNEWESYVRSLTADTFSDGEPSPKIVSLRRELLSGATLVS